MALKKILLVLGLLALAGGASYVMVKNGSGGC
jgi:hypothetical protein